MAGKIIVWILMVLLTGLVIATLFFFHRRQECYNNPNPWCYEDWQCIDKDSKAPFKVESLKELRERCSVIDEKRALALTDRGCYNFYNAVRHEGCVPGNKDRCTPKDPSKCAPEDGPSMVYTEGDIDWTLETGCVEAKGYTVR